MHLDLLTEARGISGWLDCPLLEAVPSGLGREGGGLEVPQLGFFVFPTCRAWGFGFGAWLVTMRHP